jgi:transcriptional regulator with XRE-family HTH domain
MATWANVIPHRNLLKPSKAWCPFCYEEFKHEGVPVFDPLLWSLSVVTTCAKHRLRLRSRCPWCDRAIPHLDSHSRPGFCSKCNSWLGQLPLESGQAGEDILGEELERQAWVTEQLCTLLASTPRIENPPKKEAVTKSIKFCIGCIAGMTESRFARAIGVSQPTVNDWQRQGNIPELEKLLRIARFTQIPLLNILVGHDFNQHASAGAASSICKQHEPKDPLRPHKRRTRIDIEKVRIALESALSVEITPSLQEVARSLGYSSTALTKHFPVECKKLSEKYKQWRKAVWWSVAVELEKELVREPPQSIRVIANNLKRNHTSLYQYFPDLCRRVAQRYELYRRACREQKKENFRREIREIVIALYLEGIYPSVKRVEARLHQRRTIRRSKLALDTLCQVRAECGIPTAPNNFARFAIT